MAELNWQQDTPTVPDESPHSEDYYWARGYPFNRPVMVRANFGVFSELVDGKLVFRPTMNFTFMAEGLPSMIWTHDLPRYGLDFLEWAGPVPRPGELHG